jgi:hypothetical protein
LFRVVGMYENSANAARIIMTVATAPPSAAADHVKAEEWYRIDWYMAKALYAV